MRLVDAHHHLWDPGRAYYPLLHGFSRAARGGPSYLPADYSRDVAGHDVAGTIHVEGAYDPGDPLGETRWLTTLPEGGRPRAIVAYADLRSASLDEVLSGHRHYPAVRGIRQMLDLDPSDGGSLHHLLESDRWLAGLEAVADRRLVFLAQLETPYLPQLAAVARALPHLTIVLCHAGLRGRAAHSQWIDTLERLAACPNVVVTVSGLPSALGRWDRATAVALTQAVLARFGAERVMFGSNFPVDREAVTFGELVATARRAVAHLTEREKQAFFAGTAARIYDLDLHRDS